MCVINAVGPYLNNYNTKKIILIFMRLFSAVAKGPFFYPFSLLENKKKFRLPKSITIKRFLTKN